MLLKFLSQKKVAQTSALFLLIALFVWSCNPKSTKRVDVKVSEYKGEDLFRGIMFADGKVADLIPEIKKIKDFIVSQPFNDKEKIAIKTLQDSLITKLHKSDPDYFKAFQYNIQSGNQVVVASTIRNASVLINTLLYENNKGLSQLLDNRQNELFRRKLSNSKDYQRLTNLKDSLSSNSKAFKELLTSLNKDLRIDRDVYINKVTDININKNIDINIDRNININKLVNTLANIDFDLGVSKNANSNLDRDFAINRNINVFQFLGVNKNLQTHFDRTNINRSSDIDFNPAASVTVDVDVAVYAVAVVAVAVVAVAVLVLGTPIMDDDKGDLFNDQLINSITVKLNLNQQGFGR